MLKLLQSVIAALIFIDFYKADHRRQYPNGTKLVNTNLTPRSIKWLATVEGTDDKVVAFGMQGTIAFIEEMFNNFFAAPREEVMRQYKRRLDNALGKDAVPIEHIGELHDLGYLPISVRALPEGTVVKAGIPLFTIENTIPEFFWLTNYLETALSNLSWKAITSATIARKYRQLLTNYARLTGAPLDFVKFQGHDFSARGMSGMPDGASSGAGHLIFFVGTDTCFAIDYVELYYDANSDEELVGCSIPATEHSVMCMGGKLDERGTFKRLITELYPDKFVAIVSDTWDFWNVVTVTVPSLHNEIMARDGKVVLRPDSGDPVDIVAGEAIYLDDVSDASIVALLKGGNHFFESEGRFYRASFVQGGTIVDAVQAEEVQATPQLKGAVQCLWETFGGTMTEKDFKVLDSHIGLIYGDSITLARADAILKRLAAKGFASCNVVFGVGSFTYEYQTRDTLGLAMKATAGIVGDETREIFKEPATDTGGFKKSARGFLQVVEANGEYTLNDRVSREVSQKESCLVETYRDGKWIVREKFSTIRDRAEATIV